MSITDPKQTAQRDRVSLEIWRQTYAQLSGEVENTLCDNALDDAFDLLIQYSSALFTNGSDRIPDTWSPWLVAEAKLLVAPREAPQDESDLARARDRIRNQTLRQLVDTVVDTTPDADTANTNNPQLDLQEIRRYVTRGIAMQGEVPTIQGIDSVADEVLNEVFHMKTWSFRRRFVQLSIATSQAVTVTANSRHSETDLNASKMASANIYLENASGQDSGRLRWATADQMAQLVSDQQATTGTPIWFRFAEDDTASETPVWQFWPQPDQTYTARCELYDNVSPSITNSDTDLTMFPSEFHMPIKLRILAKVARRMNLPNSNVLMRESDDQIESLMVTIDDPGLVDDMIGTPDVYGDYQGLRSNQRTFRII